MISQHYGPSVRTLYHMDKWSVQVAFRVGKSYTLWRTRLVTTDSDEAAAKAQELRMKLKEGEYV